MSVPVLSKIAVRQVGRRSKTVGSFMIIPRFAAIEMALIIVIGIAMSKGQGVAMTNTARKRPTSPVIYQTRNAIINTSGEKDSAHLIA